MGTATDRELASDERERMPKLREEIAVVGALGRATRFTFFAAFDGTNNDKSNLKLSGDEFSTNIGQLDFQASLAAESNPYILSSYYPGVGTGGDQGGLVQAAFAPTSAINAVAERAYADFRRAALEHLDTKGATIADIGASVVGFSRGCPSGIRFAQLVNERGLRDADNQELAKPGSIPITGMALIDPVARFVEGPMHIPSNVQGQVLSVMAEHENRSDFRPLYYGDDPRVTTVVHPGNHVGIGGGYDPHGTAANVLEGVTGYFQNRKIAIADVPPERRHDPHQPQQLYTEAFATARNGDVLAREDGSSIERWQLDDVRHGRIEVRPQIPPAHASWLNQIEQDLGPRMTEAGYTPEQCQRVATACAGRWAQEGGAEMPTRLLLSKDQERIGWLDGQGRLAELRIDEALAPQQSTGANTVQTHSAQERGLAASALGGDVSAAGTPVPVMEAPVRAR